MSWFKFFSEIAWTGTCVLAGAWVMLKNPFILDQSMANRGMWFFFGFYLLLMAGDWLLELRRQKEVTTA